MADEKTQGEEQQEEQKALTHIESGERGLQLRSLDEMYRFAQYVAASKLVPKGMTDVPTIMVAVQMGQEVGMYPMQALQNIAVINGRPSIWGDAVPGLARGSGKMEWYKETLIGEKGTDSYGYRVTTKRRGDPDPLITEFTVADARQAKLWGKEGPWTFYPERMLKNRARAFNIRDNFPDVMKGLYTAEEVQDVEFEIMDEAPVSTADRVKSSIAAKAAELGVDVSPPNPVSVDTPPEPPPPPGWIPIEETPPPPEEKEKAKQETPKPAQAPKPSSSIGESVEAILDLLGEEKVTAAQLREAGKAAGVKLGVPQNLSEEDAAKILKELG